MKISIRAFCLIMILMVTGCNRKEIFKAIPWQPLVSAFSFESNEEKKYPLTLNFSTGNALNPDQEAEGNPVVMIVFYLKKNDLFDKASYDALFKNPSQEITDDLIDRQEFELRPDEHKKIQKDVNQNCRCICFMAACKVLLNCVWRKCVAFDKDSSEEWTIYINNKGLEKIEATNDS